MFHTFFFLIFGKTTDYAIRFKQFFIYLKIYGKQTETTLFRYNQPPGKKGCPYEVLPKKLTESSADLFTLFGYYFKLS